MPDKVVDASVLAAWCSREPRALEALALPIRWSNVDHGAVLRLALDSNLATYDASYLYLAQALSVPLATFDQQLSRAAQGTGS